MIFYDFLAFLNVTRCLLSTCFIVVWYLLDTTWSIFDIAPHLFDDSLTFIWHSLTWLNVYLTLIWYLFDSIWLLLDRVVFEKHWMLLTDLWLSTVSNCQVEQYMQIVFGFGHNLFCQSLSGMPTIKVFAKSSFSASGEFWKGG